MLTRKRSDVRLRMMKNDFQKNWIQLFVALGMIALFSLVEYGMIPKGAKGNLEGGLLILVHYALVAVLLFPLTLWAFVIVANSDRPTFRKTLVVGIHAAALCATAMVPKILIPLIETMK